MHSEPVLVTGATGYVGGRLVSRLLNAGHRVRAYGRSYEKLACRPWGRHPRLEIFTGDVLDAPSLIRAAQGCWAAFYLVHSMNSGKQGFVSADRVSAENMVTAGARAELDRIIYLGGLGEADHPHLSRHLQSRHEVGDILRDGSVPVTILRAAMILGAGSASFEILRYLVDRLPIMITPRWVHTPSQPIAIGDVLTYLEGCLVHDQVRGETFDIGGSDVLSYRNLIDIFAEEAGLPPRRVIPVPFLTPGLSARWIHLITPVPSSIAQPLAEGLSIPTVCRDNRIRDFMPVSPTACRDAIRAAMDRISQEQVETCWMDAGEIVPPEWAYCGDADYTGGTIMSCGYRARIRAEAGDVWRTVSCIGGKTGWYFANSLWWLRGFLDRLIGGIGLRRGRRHPTEIRVGEALDFWRVLDVQHSQRLLLLAEMKLPGEALLDIRIAPQGPSQCELTLHSRFLPRGLGGLLYWYFLYPFHEAIFYGMLKYMAFATQRPLVGKPQRFTPRLHTSCVLPGSGSSHDFTA